jgi:rSAM/selenodomain-associated transferase 2/rSAM/selenodomain-associated transferase 1
MSKRLILMLKFPTPGAVKTRLVPALGEQRACALHRALVRHTLVEVQRCAAEDGVAVEVRLAGAPDDAAARAWLGGAVTIRDQGDGDLGARMDRAVQAAFAEGAAAVVVIGGDCPQLNFSHLGAAFSALARSEAVLGPAADGGYYLIGLRRALPALFRGIAWGGSEVLAQTLAAARTLSVDVALLATLRDIDVPADLTLWAETPAAGAAGRGGVSVIVPALNEEASLPLTLAAVRLAGAHEIIVVDGGSADHTCEIARAHDAVVLSSAAGRARQMNCGAAVATGEFLLFLHADTLLPANWAALVRATLADANVAAGAFEFGLAGEFVGRRLIERGTNWRARHRQLPYGDQGLFVRRETFLQIGGFPDQPIMEDYEFVRRLRRRGRIALVPAVALTSARRWQRLGPLRTTLLNQLVALGYLVGISPARLAVWYRRPCPPSASGGNKRPASTLSSSG